MSRDAHAGSHILRDSFVRRGDLSDRDLVAKVPASDHAQQDHVDHSGCSRSSGERRVVGGGSDFDGNHPVKWLCFLVEINKLAPSRRT